MINKTPVVVVAAMSSKQHVIGRRNGLLWHIPDDLRRFKELTLGHPVIMGRKTFESIVNILGKPLPDRQNIVLTKNPQFSFAGVEIARSLDEAFAIALAQDPQEIHIGGGAEIYEMALPFVDRLHLTFVDDEPEGDAFFPAFADTFVEQIRHETRSHEGVTYTWVDLVRKTDAE